MQNNLLEIIIFGAVWWLGLYLVQRDVRNPILRWAGLGLATYALGLALSGLSLAAHDSGVGNADFIARAGWVCLLLPAFCWTAALLHRLPESFAARPVLLTFWRFGAAPLAGLYFVASALTPMNTATARPQDAWVYGAAFILLFLPLLLAAGLTGWLWGRERRRPGLLLVALLFFVLSLALFLTPLDWLPRFWTLLGLATDLLLLGLAIAGLDAFEQGETLLPDLIRSGVFAGAAALLFGGQVALVWLFVPNPNWTLAALLLTVVGTAIGVQVFATRLSNILDKIALAEFPRLRQSRQELKEAADALPRQAHSQNFDPALLDEAEFGKLVRRALSYLGDLPRLAASPLIYLPLIDARLQNRGVQAAEYDVLERATELKAALTESIGKLKPRTGDWGTSDEWRYYNALYFPYIVGMKPYSQRAMQEFSDKTNRAVLEWFRVSVPERTLYNWQNAAAKLVAHDLYTANLALASGTPVSAL
jgi:4-amino-4-deoxy-L-arabinose transferase-like glycosyltransferase